MDILLNSDGDLHISPQGDIQLGNSVAQKIKIRLKWLAGEWRWDKGEGLPYMEQLLIKNPDIDHFEAAVREKIFEVDEVTEVKEVTVIFDSRTRQAAIRYVAVTDLETVKEEVAVQCQITG